MTEKLSYAVERFSRTLRRKKQGGTLIYEITDHLLENVDQIYSALKNVHSNSVIWQHTPALHVAAIRIEQGTGFDYSRINYELIHRGIDSVEKYKQLWFELNNGSDIGEPPKVENYTYTQNKRKKVKLYIVANTNDELKSRYIPGSLPQNTVDRTHLLPFALTGVETSPGLLIDYDSWLNRNPMQEAESKILRLTNLHSLIWITTVYKSSKGLNIQYLIYNDATGHLIRRYHWVDDRWIYYWHSDKTQKELFRKG